MANNRSPGSSGIERDNIAVLQLDARPPSAVLPTLSQASRQECSGRRRSRQVRRRTARSCVTSHGAPSEVRHGPPFPVDAFQRLNETRVKIVPRHGHRLCRRTGKKETLALTPETEQERARLAVLATAHVSDDWMRAPP